MSLSAIIPCADAGAQRCLRPRVAAVAGRGGPHPRAPAIWGDPSRLSAKASHEVPVGPTGTPCRHHMSTPHGPAPPGSSPSRQSGVYWLRPTLPHEITLQQHGEIGVSRPRECSTAGPVSYTWVARSRSEPTSQFTALSLNTPSSSSESTSQFTASALNKLSSSSSSSS